MQRCRWPRAVLPWRTAVRLQQNYGRMNRATFGAGNRRPLHVVKSGLAFGAPSLRAPSDVSHVHLIVRTKGTRRSALWPDAAQVPSIAWMRTRKAGLASKASQETPSIYRFNVPRFNWSTGVAPNELGSRSHLEEGTQQRPLGPILGAPAARGSAALTPGGANQHLRNKPRSDGVSSA